MVYAPEQAGIHKLLIAVLIMCLFFNVSLAQYTSMVQVKTYNQNFKAIPSLEISLDDQNYFKTGIDGTVFVEISNADLPPKVIYVTDREFEAESWNYSRGILEIIIRRKTFEIFQLNVVDSSGRRLENVIVALAQDESKNSVTNKDGVLLLPIPIKLDPNDPDVYRIPDHTITDIQISGNEGTIYVHMLPLQPKEPSMANEIVRKVETRLDALDTIESLGSFYLFIRTVDMAALDNVQKHQIDRKFQQLMTVTNENVKSNYPPDGSISDTSLVSDDIVFLAEQALREGQTIIETRQEFDEKIKLISDKLSDGGINLTEAERQKLLNDVANLDQLLASNQAQFTQNQADYQSAITQLKNRLLNIKDLEDQLSASELQRAAERQAFQRQLIIVMTVIFGLVLLIGLFFYLMRKYIRQKKIIAIANDDVKRINNKLENLVAKKTKSLRRVNRELDTFLYKSSHDLKRPLTSIIGLANIAKITLNGESYELFARARKTAYEMDRLLQKLMMMSDINYPSHFSSINFPELLDKVRDRYEEYIHKNNITVTHKVEEAIQFMSYPLVIEIILRNLLENALYYGRLGDNGKPKVNVTVRTENSSIILEVEDNGCGIAKEVQNKVWKMFFVGNERSRGNGLGLYIASKAVKVVKGGLSFQTKEGQFTRFSAQLPLDKLVPPKPKKIKKKKKKLLPA